MKPHCPHILPVVLVLLLLAGPAHARTLYVNGTGSPGDGTSWASALTNLTDALDQAAPGDQIWVARGVYLPTANADRTATFRLRQGVEVYGGFSGVETELKKRDVEQHPTVLSGDIGVPGVPDDNVYHVVTATQSGVLDGFTVSGGYSANVGWTGRSTLTAGDVASGYHHGMGAGMLIFQAAPEVRHCVFQDNHALIGGGVYVMTSPADAPTAQAPASPRFTDCVFWQNSALGNGGGAANSLRTAPIYVSCVFDSNVADIRGGGMFNDFGAAPRLLNTLLRNNEAESGGGMANDGGAQPVLFYSTLTGNRALRSGPAIHQSGGPANVTVLLKTIVWDNLCECPDTRFYSAPPSEIRVRDSVIQGGYAGKSVFQANPGLDRRSETLLNTGYKTDGHRFRGTKLPHRLKDVARHEETGNLPDFDPAYVATVAPRMLTAPVTPPVPETAAPPVVETVASTAPRPEAAPAQAAAPMAEPTPAPVPEPAQRAKPEPAAPPASPAPNAIEPEPETVAMVAPETVTPVPVAPEPQVTRPAPPAPPAVEPQSADQTVSNMDMDGNGCLTINEVDGPLQQHFWRVDGNGDGCLSQAELDRADAKNGQRPRQPVARPAPPLQAAKPKAPAPVAMAPAPRAAAPAPQPKQSVTPAASPDGYTLFAPVGGRETYLIDRHGNEIKKWTGTDRSSGAAYLLANGNLLRCVSPDKSELNTPFDAPGIRGGIVQEVSPRGQVVWEYAYVNKDVRQHSDIAPMPNGNVLLLAWELKTGSDLAAAGGSVRNHPNGQVWAEHIVEVRKAGPRSGVVVWQWHSWDHLVQDTDRNAPNYASPSRLPRRIDLNHNPQRTPDWHHAESLDYNPVADQIVVSVRNANEIWIIDHSTSSAQAASGEGGIMHRGGDLLFRWGNPATWGGTGRQTLSDPHNAVWITGKRPGDATILLSNNGNTAPAVMEIKPAYYFKSTQLEAKEVWEYAARNRTNRSAEHGSSAQRLENGNTLICDGTGSRMFEVDRKGRTVWEYSHKGDGHLTRATRLAADHPGVRRLLR